MGPATRAGLRVLLLAGIASTRKSSEEGGTEKGIGRSIERERKERSEDRERAMEKRKARDPSNI